MRKYLLLLLCLSVLATLGKASAQAPAPPQLVWGEFSTTSSELRRSNNVNSGQSSVIVGLPGQFYGVTYDPTQNNVYFMMEGGGGQKTVRQVSAAGGASQPIATAAGYAHGLAIAPMAQELYWTDDSNNLVMKAPVNPPGAAVPFVDGLFNPMGLALDETAGFLYVAEGNGSSPRIIRIDLSNRTAPGVVLALASSLTEIGGFRGIALNRATGDLFFNSSSSVYRVTQPSGAAPSVPVVIATNVFGDAKGMSIDSNNSTLYVADALASGGTPAGIRRLNLLSPTTPPTTVFLGQMKGVAVGVIAGPPTPVPTPTPTPASPLPHLLWGGVNSFGTPTAFQLRASDDILSGPPRGLLPSSPNFAIEDLSVDAIRRQVYAVTSNGISRTSIDNPTITAPLIPFGAGIQGSAVAIIAHPTSGLSTLYWTEYDTNLAPNALSGKVKFLSNSSGISSPISQLPITFNLVADLVADPITQSVYILDVTPSTGPASPMVSRFFRVSTNANTPPSPSTPPFLTVNAAVHGMALDPKTNRLYFNTDTQLYRIDGLNTLTPNVVGPLALSRPFLDAQRIDFDTTNSLLFVADKNSIRQVNVNTLSVTDLYPESAISIAVGAIPILPIPTATPSPTASATATSIPTFTPTPLPRITPRADVGKTIAGRSPTLTGVAAPGTTIVVLLNGVEVARTVAVLPGRWSTSLSTPLALGENQVRFIATTPDGQQIDFTQFPSLLVVTRAVNDFDGDGETDRAAYYPFVGGALAYTWTSSATGLKQRIVMRGRVPVTDDWDNDGRTDFGGIERIASVKDATDTYAWRINLSRTNEVVRADFGTTGDRFLTGCRPITAGVPAMVAVRGNTIIARELTKNESASAPFPVSLATVVGCLDSDSDGIDEIVVEDRREPNASVLQFYDIVGTLKRSVTTRPFTRAVAIPGPEQGQSFGALIRKASSGYEVTIIDADRALATISTVPRRFILTGGVGFTSTGQSQPLVLYQNLLNGQLARRFVTDGSSEEDIGRIRRSYLLLQSQYIHRTTTK